MALEILTRFDEIRKNVIPYTGSATIVAGTWITKDANGNAAAPTALGSGELVLLGNEFNRPDSIGSESVTTQYGINRYKVGTEGYEGSPAVGTQLEIGATANGLGHKLRALTAGIVVAEVEKVEGNTLTIKTLR